MGPRRRVAARPDPRRGLSRTDAVLADPRLVAAAERLGRGAVKFAVCQAQDRARRDEIAPSDAVGATVRTLPATATALRPVINATGVLLHTNLGRAALSERPGRRCSPPVTPTSSSTSPPGDRAARGRLTVVALLGRVPAAQVAHVVDNGAAALVLATTALAPGREIIVSRGELVEIGDGFRLPDRWPATRWRVPCGWTR